MIIGTTMPISGKTTLVWDNLKSINKIPQTQSVANMKIKLRRAKLKNLAEAGK